MSLNRKLFVLLAFYIFSTIGCVTMMLTKEDQLALKGKYADLAEALEEKIKRDGELSVEEHLYLCGAYSELKNYKKLFNCAQNSSIKNRLQTLVNLSSAYIELGRYDKAIELAETVYQSVVAHEKQNESMRKYGFLFSYKIVSLGNLGVAYALSGNISKAEKIATHIAKYKADWAEEEHRNRQLARVYVALKRYNDALNIISDDNFTSKFIKATSILDPTVNMSFKISATPFHFIKNKCLFETGSIKQAKAGYDNLLAFEHTCHSRSMLWQILADRGRIAIYEGHYEEGIEFLKNAVDVIEQQRSTINTEASKIGFVGDKQAIYHDLVSILIDRGRLEDAFSFAERGKSRALVDMLASKKQFSILKEVDTSHAVKLLNDLDNIEMKSIEKDYRITTQEHEKTRSVIVAKKNEITQSFPELASLITVTSPEVTEIQQLLPSDETLVEYFGSGDTLFAFIVDHDRVVGTKLDVKGLRQDIELFRYLIMDSDSNRFKEYGQVLFNKIIQPIEGKIGSKNVTIIPHGALHYLPFNALYSDNGFMIDRYSIRVLPSASVMKFLKDRQESHAGNLLAFGNPDLGDPTYDLPGAQDETIAITKGKPKSKLLLRNQATETAVKQYGAGFRYLHFATHGTFDAKKPLSSGLLMTGDGKNDGTLTVGELYDMRLPADLVTLSACETALGKVANGDDVVGFTRGFLYAGTSSIVSSLWKVDDQATSMLMQQFYKSLKENDKRSALRTAQLKVKDTYNSHPYFWAAFQITGSVQ